MKRTLESDRNAVRVALEDAHSKGKMRIASLLYTIPEKDLDRFRQGEDAALTDAQVQWLVLDLVK